MDPSWTPARLSGAILAAALSWVAPGSALIVVDGLAGTLLPVVIGRLVDDVVTPAASGIGWDAVVGPLAGWLGVVAGLYLVMNLSHRFGGRLGWYGVQRTQFELAQATVGRILDERGLDGPARPPGALLSVARADVHRACLVLYAAVYPPGQVVALLGAASSCCSSTRGWASASSSACPSCWPRCTRRPSRCGAAACASRRVLRTPRPPPPTSSPGTG